MKKVKIDDMNGGYAIFIFDANRHYSRIAKNNEYIPITYSTRAEVVKVCEEAKYEIIGFEEDYDDYEDYAKLSEDECMRTTKKELLAMLEDVDDNAQIILQVRGNSTTDYSEQRIAIKNSDNRDVFFIMDKLSC